MKPLVLHFEQGGGPGTIFRRVVLEGGDERVRPLEWRFPEEASLPDPVVLDGFVFEVLLYAMSLGRTLRVEGPVSAKALRNARLLQEAWRCLKPAEYAMIDIDPAAVETLARSPVERAISGFSGGLDASFTAIRHASGTEAAFPLTDVLLIHGFDMDPSDDAVFGSYRRRVEPLLSRLNLTPRVIRHVRPFGMLDWHDTFGAQLATGLHNFSHAFGYGLIGSSEPYDHIVLPWGSTPATDYLLSGARMEIVHDGAGFSRTQKAERLARDETATSTLRVCWQGRQQDRNCGVCEKCVRTRLNFLAVGAGDIPAFDQPFSPDQMAALIVDDPLGRAELTSIVEYAERAGGTQGWLNDLKALLAGPPASRRAAAGS